MDEAAYALWKLRWQRAKDAQLVRVLGRAVDIANELCEDIELRKAVMALVEVEMAGREYPAEKIKRNSQLIGRLLGGESVGEVAKEFGMSYARVSEIWRRYRGRRYRASLESKTA